MTGNGFDCNGTVPGSVYSFLLDNGLMKDPYYRQNELEATPLMEYDYTFSRSFSGTLYFKLYSAGFKCMYFAFIPTSRKFIFFICESSFLLPMHFR